jgi:hypothetical protein
MSQISTLPCNAWGDEEAEGGCSQLNALGSAGSTWLRIDGALAAGGGEVKVIVRLLLLLVELPVEKLIEKMLRVVLTVAGLCPPC